MRLIVRAALLAALLFWHASPLPAAEQVNAPVVSCESAPAADSGDVQIGTALLLARGPGAAEVIADCDGTVSID